MADDGAAGGSNLPHPPPPPRSVAPGNPSRDASSFTRTPFYCEENVYLLHKELIRSGIADPTGTDLYAVFISNEEKKVPLWRNKGEVLDLVWDLDSSLPFPCPFVRYVSDAIQPLSFGDSIYRRLFRVVHGPVFLRSFASDRSHMKDPLGNWIELPPNYEPIVAEDGNTNNLNEYIAMSMCDVGDLESMVNDVHSNKNGVVINETLLPEFFSRLPG